jgi:hypothetical protein
MSIPFLSVRPSAIKLKVYPNFPAQLNGGTGIAVIKANGIYTVGLDYSQFGIVPTPPANTYTLVYEPVAKSFVLTPPGTGTGTTRTKLTANRTYLVNSATGSDANDGYTAPFATTAKAMQVVGDLDCGPYQLTVSLSAHTYTAPISLPRVLYGGPVPILTGVVGTFINPATGIAIAGGSTCAIVADGATPWVVQNFKFGTSNAAMNFGLAAVNGSLIKYGGIEFAAFAGSYQAYCDQSSSLICIADYTITGGSQLCHVIAAGFVSIRGRTITLTGTFAYATTGNNGFVAAYGGSIDLYGTTWNDAAATVTGIKCYANTGGGIVTYGNGTISNSYFPGSINGVIDATTYGWLT